MQGGFRWRVWLKGLLCRFRIQGPWLTEHKCDECRKPCGSDRPQVFGGFVCSDICDWAMSGYLDGCGLDETRIEAEELRRDPEARRKAMKLAGIRPD
jgi:hypothetical protein